MPTPPSQHPQAVLEPGQTLRIDAACVADATAQHAPGTLVLQREADTARGGWVVLSSGRTPTDSGTDRSDSFVDLGPVTRTLSLPTSTILPPFVNAHAHLDLTSLGPRPYDPAHGFDTWLSMIRSERPTTPEAIRAAVDRGIELSLAGGVVAVGDIAGMTSSASGGVPRLEPFQALAASPMLGVSFVEFFAIGKMEQAAMARIEKLLDDHAAQFAECGSARARLGLQPHAPYSVGLGGYERLLDLTPANVPLCTHLAETLAERQFISEAAGPQFAFLDSLGLWDDTLLRTIGQGRSPVQHLRPILERSNGPVADTPRPPWVLAHVNDASDADITTLAGVGASVVYCPRAHKYFDNAEALGPHRWQGMLDAGVNVCLGTDSIVNLDTPDRMTPLDDARLIYQRSVDGAGVGSGAADPLTLLRMITTNPGEALGLGTSGFTFQPGSRPLGFVELENTGSLADAMATNGRIRSHG